MKRQLPSQILEQQFFSLAARRAPLAESIQLGAQLMLQKAVELEVTEFLGRDHYQRSGDETLRGYRNGYQDKQVQTAEGPLPLKMPQVRYTIEAFESLWLRALVRRSDKLAALIPQLYVKGLSTRDIEAALFGTVEVDGVTLRARTGVPIVFDGRAPARSTRTDSPVLPAVTDHGTVLHAAGDLHARGCPVRSRALFGLPLPPDLWLNRTDISR